MPAAEPLRYDSLMMMRGLDVGFLLDRQWHALRGEMETTKRPALIALAGVLEDTAIPYAIIGGIALQAHRAEARTTLDIDLAVPSLEAIPRAELMGAGFTRGGHFAHSENWVSPAGGRSSLRMTLRLHPRWSGRSRSTWMVFGFT